MPKLVIDMDYLTLAWQDQSPDTAYYFDIDTGDVHRVSRDLIDLDELTQEIERHRERYLYVPKADPKTLNQELKDFADSVSDLRLKSMLDVSLEAPNALFSFRAILSKYTEEMKRWQDFRSQRAQKRVIQWLDANFVEYEL